MITIAGLGDLEAALAEHGRNRELFSDACEDFDVPTMTKLDEEEVDLLHEVAYKAEKLVHAIRQASPGN
ncbi:MAG TPA: hypothetical protein PK331_14310 [Gordonia sp. (in: high G+C Gram-positive bacteria)]|uniref:hypothetical protein n=1 Tax=unclassified Gordonia (in: high G+C Gram-positive bacteria) TaxID=2657482 RepID=UPI000F978EF3|nr:MULTISPECIES: hypothetical protein [unclassified Gordonia (in: high G+C Gram-positive bacteria)]RUP37251.1 MAG: hypothetical protein EKK60_13000 [Gordonia sp. (in: high G+C Gram-positive bacteria)]HNP56260.1 hypothetical protein [Gordonia sp. (in: high G+C Gram-positive bacteria)]HRC52080.1 hypothetical protein [Gordonia sp. (in: high G+C Gram-positive bacteria)]